MASDRPAILSEGVSIVHHDDGTESVIDTATGLPIHGARITGMNFDVEPRGGGAVSYTLEIDTGLITAQAELRQKPKPIDVDPIVPYDIETHTESQYQRTIQDIAGLCGYTWSYHTHNSMRSTRGFPDLALFNPRDGGSVYFEVKNRTKMPTQEQLEWLDAQRRSGIHAYMVRPKDVYLVKEILRGSYMTPEIGSGTVHPDLRRIAPMTLDEARPPKRSRSASSRRR